MAVVWTDTVLFSFKAEKVSSTGHWLPLGSSNIDAGNSSSSIIVLITESENYNRTKETNAHRRIRSAQQPLQNNNDIKGVDIDALNDVRIIYESTHFVFFRWSAVDHQFLKIVSVVPGSKEVR